MRKYSRIEMLKFAALAKKNPKKKGLDLLEKYNKENPELTTQQKWENLAKAIGL